MSRAFVRASSNPPEGDRGNQSPQTPNRREFRLYNGWRARTTSGGSSELGERQISGDSRGKPQRQISTESRGSGSKSRALLQDPRRAVGHRGPEGKFVRQTSPPEQLKAPLPAATKSQAVQKTPSEKPKPPAPTSSNVLLGRLWCGFGGKVASICSKGFKEREQPKQVSSPPPPPPRRWYRVHPLNDITCYVRPDPGIPQELIGTKCRNHGYEERVSLPRTNSGEVEEEKSPTDPKAKKRTQSLPPEVDRFLGLPPEALALWDNLCKICYDRQSTVILLPCRHSGMCEKCMVRSCYSRPAHRGGNRCPFCRKRIKETVRICEESIFPQYGYAIKTDCFSA